MKVTALQIQRALISSKKLLPNVTFPDTTEPSVKTSSSFQIIILFLNRDFFSLSSSNKFQLSYFLSIFPHLSNCFTIFNIIISTRFCLPPQFNPVEWYGLLQFHYCSALHRRSLYLSPKAITNIWHQKLEGMYPFVVQSPDRAQHRRIQLGGYCCTAPQPLFTHHP